MKRRAFEIAFALLAGALFLTEARAQTAIIDMTPAERYQGLQGGRYPGGTNVPPANHDAEGRARAGALQPIGGKIVLLTIGLSNSDQEWCGKNAAKSLPCNAWTFMGQAASSPSVNHDDLVILNGALSAQETETWDEPTDTNYPRIEENWLTPLGLTPSQVQVVQMLEMTGPVFDGTTRDPETPRLPASSSDAYYLVSQYGAIARTLKQVYPNLRMIFVSPRSYGGFGTSADGNSNPETYAYETGFAAKLFVQAQLTQCPTTACTGPIDARAGDLSYANGSAPWITWGAYLWADGSRPNSEGLFYVREDYQSDTGQHPTTAGETLIGGKLLDFYLSSPYTTPWFTTGGGTSCTDDHTCLRSSDIFLWSRGRIVLTVTGTVTVENDQGSAVSGASVDATWTLPDGSQVNGTGTTDASGKVSLAVTGSPGTYTIRVTDITKPGWTFDPSSGELTKTIRR